jgi:hypothetical protein
LTRYEKDRPFNQLRAEIYLKTHWYPDKQQAQTMYVNNRETLKPINKTLHEFFYKGGRANIYKIVNDYTRAKFIDIPKQFKEQVKKARFLTHHGNDKVILLEADDYYYLYHWSGS